MTRLRRTLSFTLAVLLMFSMSTTALAFDDVGADQWYAEAVDHVRQNNLMDGISEAEFAPDASLDRATAVSILWRMAGSPATPGALTFKDVPADEPAADAVRWAQENGIVSGYDAETFGMSNAVTNEQLAVMLYRYAQTEGGSVADFSRSAVAVNGKISSWATTALYWAINGGMLRNPQDSLIRPQAAATRAEMAYALFNHANPKTVPTTAVKANIVLKEQGNFSVGGTVVTSEGVFDPMQPWMVPQGGQTRHGDHADVLYQIPVDANAYPMVMLHGYGQTRRSWQTTADGREGFSNLFLREGYSTYLVDQPGRGEAGQVTGAGQITATPDDQTWYTQFRFGLWPNLYDGVQISQDSGALDQFFRMMVPDTGTTADRNATVTAMSDLFDQTGPGIFFTHSASGFTGWQTAIANENVAAIVSLEPGGFPFPLDPNADPAQSFGGVSMDDFMKLTRIPIIVYYGDFIPDSATGIPSQDFWRQSLASARQWAELINSHGGDATIVHLPEIGISGNTHFIMSDLNNQEIAEHIDAWLMTKGLK